MELLATAQDLCGDPTSNIDFPLFWGVKNESKISVLFARWSSPLILLI